MVVRYDWSVMDWYFHGAAPVEVTLSLLITLLIVYEIWFDPMVKAWSRRRLLAKTFELRILDHQRTVAKEERQTLNIVIVFHNAVQVNAFNLRFISVQDGDASSRRISPAIIEIESVDDPPLSLLRSRRDGEGGLHCFWEPHIQPKFFYASQELNLVVVLVAHRPWSGYLSFKGYDADGERQFARHSLCVTSEPYAALDAGSASSTMS